MGRISSLSGTKNWDVSVLSCSRMTKLLPIGLLRWSIRGDLLFGLSRKDSRFDAVTDWPGAKYCLSEYRAWLEPGLNLMCASLARTEFLCIDSAMLL